MFCCSAVVAVAVEWCGREEGHLSIWLASDSVNSNDLSLCKACWSDEDNSRNKQSLYQVERCVWCWHQLLQQVIYPAWCKCLADSWF